MEVLFLRSKMLKVYVGAYTEKQKNLTYIF